MTSGSESRSERLSDPSCAEAGRAAAAQRSIVVSSFMKYNVWSFLGDGKAKYSGCPAVRCEMSLARVRETEGGWGYSGFFYRAIGYADDLQPWHGFRFLHPAEVGGGDEGLGVGGEVAEEGIAAGEV